MSLTLIAGVILVAALSATEVSHSNGAPSGIVAIAVPTAPVTGSQALPTQTATPASSPAIIYDISTWM